MMGWRRPPLRNRRTERGEWRIICVQNVRITPDSQDITTQVSYIILLIVKVS